MSKISKEEKEIIFSSIIFFILFISFIIIASANLYDYFKNNEFCKRVYPPFESYVRGGIEEGYIKYCRYTYINHEEQIECEIFKR